MYVIVYQIDGEREWQVHAAVQGTGANREPLIMWANEGNALDEARRLAGVYFKTKWGVSEVLSPKIVERTVYPQVREFAP